MNFATSGWHFFSASSLERVDDLLALALLARLMHDIEGYPPEPDMRALAEIGGYMYREARRNKAL